MNTILNLHTVFKNITIPLVLCLYSSGKVEEANINRSPSSYEANPEEEKAK